MRRQRNNSQMKEQNKTPGKELSETERSNLSDTEFKTLVIRMLKELTGYFNGIKRPRWKCRLLHYKLYREPTVMGRSLGFKSTIWNIRKK